MQGIVSGGKNTYGEVIGIILTDRIFPRIPGEMGNATTFNFPVKFNVVKGLDVSTRYRMFSGSSEFVEPFIQSAKELEEIGVKAITTNCGFLVLYQDVILSSVDIPVFTSSLLQIPLIYKMLNKNKKIGIITAEGSSRGLGPKHLKAAGAENVPVIIRGMENSEGFKAIGENKMALNIDLLTMDIVNIALEMTTNNPDIGAIVLECTNLPPYSKAIQDAVGLPVFDIITLTNWVYSSIVTQEFKGHM